ncbi:MAG: hypothetical protein ACE5HT_15080 [Gemmatimonadales bacterium]
MPPFIESTIHWATVTGGHFILMLWWIWAGAVVATVLSEAFVFDRWRARVLAARDDGRRTVVLAAVLGILSPPSRRRIFRQARELLASGVSRGGVMAYLVSAQALFLWFVFFIVELDGPQPVVGQFVAVAVALVVLMYGLKRTPESLWESARRDAVREMEVGTQAPPIARRGPVLVRIGMSLGHQIYSLWWPLLFGLLGVGFFLALGQSPGYLSLQGTKGPLVQVGNGIVGLLLAYVTGAPLVGNTLFAAGLWKAEFVTYAGLSAFYLGTLVMPFTLHRYFALLGVELGKKVLVWLVIAILVGALAATAWWWGLHWTLGVTGLRDWFEGFTHSTMRPNDVPWFHHWFQSMPPM